MTLRKTPPRVALATVAVAVTAFTGAAGAATPRHEGVDHGPRTATTTATSRAPTPRTAPSDRKVTVFKQLGSAQRARRPTRRSARDIGRSPTAPSAMWSIGNSGYKTGEFYAKAAKVPGSARPRPRRRSRRTTRAQQHARDSGAGGFGRRAVSRRRPDSGRCGSRCRAGIPASAAVSRARPARPAPAPSPGAGSRGGSPSRRRSETAPAGRGCGGGDDDRQAARLVVAVERQRGERAADHVRRADAVARVAEARSGFPASSSRITGRWVGRDVDRPAPGVLDAPSREAGKKRQQVALRPRRSRSGSTLGAPVRCARRGPPAHRPSRRRSGRRAWCGSSGPSPGSR